MLLAQSRGEASEQEAEPIASTRKCLYHSLLADLDIRWCYLSRWSEHFVTTMQPRPQASLCSSKGHSLHHGRKKIKCTSQKNFKSFSASPVTANSYFSNKPFSQVATILTPFLPYRKPKVSYQAKKSEAPRIFLGINCLPQYKLKVQLHSEGLVVSHVMKVSVETGKKFKENIHAVLPLAFLDSEMPPDSCCVSQTGTICPPSCKVASARVATQHGRQPAVGTGTGGGCVRRRKEQSSKTNQLSTPFLGWFPDPCLRASQQTRDSSVTERTRQNF